MTPPPYGLIDRTLMSAAADVAWDEVLLREVDDGSRPGPLLRLWEPPRHAVVLGRANRVTANVDIAACRAGGVPLVRRFSGGGTVLVGPGSLCFTLVAPLDPAAPRDISAKTRELLNPLIEGLSRATGEAVDLRGTSDLVIGDRKFGGNAQRWLKRTVLHHGTLAYALNIDLVEKYLTPPEREPEYRGGRGHREFVRNLPLGSAELRSAVIGSFGATPAEALVPGEALEAAVSERYGDDGWTFSR